MSILEKVVFNFSQEHAEFSERFFSLLQNVIEYENDKIILKRSDYKYYPMIEINCYSEDSNTYIFFMLDNGQKLKVDIKNKTNVSKVSHLKYSHIALEDIFERFTTNDIEIVKMDHIGFNLPWFSDGIHPEINNLRTELSGSSLYHTFPTGEPWDFIIPASKEEIEYMMKTDYSAERKPKIELVSFTNCSIPIIQFDVSCPGKKDMFKTSFPEGMYDEKYGFVWLYVKNPFGLDLCLVLNEYHDGDWSKFFENDRL